MKMEINIHIYSSIPNPKFSISQERCSELMRQIPELISSADAPQTGSPIAVRAPGVYGRLGYRGISLSFPNQQAPIQLGNLELHVGQQLHIDSGVIDLGLPGPLTEPSAELWFGDWRAWHSGRSASPNLWDPERKLERHLLNEAVNSASENQPDLDSLHALETQRLIRQQISELEVPVSIEHLQLLVAAHQRKWDHALARIWNIQRIIENNNCYNFATNVIGTTPAEPGRCNSPMKLAPADRVEGLLADNISQLRSHDLPAPHAKPSAGHNIALFTWPDTNDYHCYRQLTDGSWAHKPAGGKATDAFDGEPIVDPRKINHNNGQFEGYFFCPSDVNVC